MVALVAAGLLTAGCGPSDTEDRAGGAAQKALPVAIDGTHNDVVLQRHAGEKLKITPLPATGAPFVEKVEHNLRQTALRSARVPGEISAKCPDGVDGKGGAVSQCAAMYEGADSLRGEDQRFSQGRQLPHLLRHHAQEGPAGAKTVYDSLNESYGPRSGRTDTLTCDGRGRRLGFAVTGGNTNDRTRFTAVMEAIREGG